MSLDFLYNASIAQWLEHWSCKPGVVSSILTGGLFFVYMLLTIRFKSLIFLEIGLREKQILIGRIILLYLNFTFDN